MFSVCLYGIITHIAMDVESIVKQYHSQMVIPGMTETVDLVSPWFNRMRCFDEGVLLPRCTVATVAIIGVVCGFGTYIRVKPACVGRFSATTRT